MQIVIDISDIPKNDHQRWALANGTVLKDVLKDFLEWYTLPFNDSLLKHTDEVIQEFMDYQKGSTDADSD